MKKIVYTVLIVLITVSLYAEKITVINDRDYFDQVHTVLRFAQKSILVVMFAAYWYDTYPESPSNILIQDLVAAHRKGRDVRVILNQDMPKSSFLGKKSLQPYNHKTVIDYFISHGVEVKIDSPDVSTHSKLIIVDSRFSIVGSTNWSYSGIIKNHEANVLIDSKKVAKEFTQYFNDLWKNAQ